MYDFDESKYEAVNDKFQRSDCIDFMQPIERPVHAMVSNLKEKYPHLVPTRRMLRYDYESGGNDTVSAKNAITTRLSRQALMQIATQMEAAGETFQNPRDERYRDASAKAAYETVKKWVDANGVFDPLESTETIGRIDSLSEGMRNDVKYISMGMMYAGKESSLKWVSAYEKIRNAVCRVLTPDDIDKMRPVYQQSVITEEELGALGEDIEEFQKRSKKGLFVRGFDEPDDEGVTIADEMRRDLAAKPEAGYGSYKGHCLEDPKTGKFLSWLTYWKTPEETSQKYLDEKLHPYLDRGATNNEKLFYWGRNTQKLFRDNASKCMLFDTIAASVPGASNRLAAHAFTDIEKTSTELYYVLLYRLKELHFIPAWRKWDFDWWNNAENQKSRDFFTDRAFHTLMDDVNLSEDASVPSVWRNVKGERRRMVPSWVHHYGHIVQVNCHSRAIWADSRVEVGDNTDDGLGIAEEPPEREPYSGIAIGGGMIGH